MLVSVPCRAVWVWLDCHHPQVAAKTWLATFDPRATHPPDATDTKYLKEFLRRKYTDKECVGGIGGDDPLLQPSSPSAPYAWRLCCERDAHLQ